MKYTHRYQIKWHDTDANRNVAPSQLLAYMQETAHHQLASVGMSLDELRDTKRLAFLLSRIAIRIYRQLHAYETIDVETWICESRGLSFHRCFRVLRNQEVVAEAFSVWALMDLDERKLLPSTAFPYRIEPESPLALSVRARIPSINLMEEAGAREIVYSDIDYNGHMNNTHYPNMLCDFTPDIRNKQVVGLTLSFLHEASFGHTIRIYRTEQGNECFFRTLDEHGNTCLEALMVTEPICEVGT